MKITSSHSKEIGSNKHAHTSVLSLFIFVCAVCFSIITSQAAAESSPAFWQVKDEKSGSMVYLLGSMHFGHSSFYPLNPKITQAFERSEVLAVELDITQIDPVKTMQLILSFGQLPAGHTLKSAMDNLTWNRLVDRCQQLGMDIRAFESLKPWFVALQLVGLQLNFSDFKQSLGIDRYFLERVGSRQVVAFETIEQQLSLFNDLEIATQVEFLRETLTEFDRGESYLLELAQYWQEGDIANLEKFIIVPMRDNPKTSVLFKKIFTERNYQMVDSTIALLNRGKTAFVIVGAGHLVGTEGIVNLLKDKGWKIERLL